jgi:hypothetical protein
MKFVFVYRRVVRQIHATAPRCVVVLMPLLPRTSVTLPPRLRQLQDKLKDVSTYNADVEAFNANRTVHFANNRRVLCYYHANPTFTNTNVLHGDGVHLKQNMQYKYACHVRKALWAGTAVYDSLYSA